MFETPSVLLMPDANVTPDQFEVRDAVVLHKPTEAEFIPHPEREDSVIVWTERRGKTLSDGAVYQYADVSAAMNAVWRETSKRPEGSIPA